LLVNVSVKGLEPEQKQYFKTQQRESHGGNTEAQRGLVSGHLLRRPRNSDALIQRRTQRQTKHTEGHAAGYRTESQPRQGFQ